MVLGLVYGGTVIANVVGNAGQPGNIYVVLKSETVVGY